MACHHSILQNAMLKFVRPIVLLLILVTLASISPSSASAITRTYQFKIAYKTVNRLCYSKKILAVNDQYPGPTIYANEGDRVVINVTNLTPHNISIHWHGIRQFFSAWHDGPAYVTQCPIQEGRSYSYNFTITKQSGTLFWHAHNAWLRGTVYGAIVIYPENSLSGYPFRQYNQENTLILGEWWNKDVLDVESDAVVSGAIAQIADAYTINGLPGPLYDNCSSADTYELDVIQNRTYLIRLINAALNTELFFKIAGHNMTVVEIDGDFTKEFVTDTIFITPGQTTTFLLETNQANGKYYMGASPYSTTTAPYQQTVTLGIIAYSGSSNYIPLKPSFPSPKDDKLANSFSRSLRSLADSGHPESVPQTVDTDLLITVGLGSKPCDENFPCTGPNGEKFVADMNNVSFVLPFTSLLHAYYNNMSGVYTQDFPSKPAVSFDYTGETFTFNTRAKRGTKINTIPFNSNVQIVFQGTSLVTGENHPIHVHGYSFYIVGQGYGNFNAKNASFNLVDPPRRNTVAVPVNGWAAIRFKADNPGLWYVHCHLELHTTWGLATALLVLNGQYPNQGLPAPPPDYPRC